MTLHLLLAPVPAIVVGVIVMIGGGVPARAWGQDVAVTALSTALLLATRREHRGAPSLATMFAVVATGIALLAATLLHGGVDGVRRWVAAGPVQLHAAAIVLPPLLLLLLAAGRAASQVAALVTLCILWLQPDAAQAAAFAAAWSVGEWGARGRAALVPVGIALLLAVATALRPDPLPPVAHVEGIVGMATHLGFGWGVLAMLGLAIPPLAWRASSDRQQGAVLATYIAITALAPMLGNFPVPYLGYGVSPIIGYYLAVAAARWQRKEVGTGITRLV